mmetsp:Transcript_13414/g.16686  ORF Transcript_13414/g.16686 Transcript_13414/m.16686 type:complete len:189 (-) Transcript_13414:1064-1630(-)|eukprot:CAMPEP_0204857392 /NCGR_PEP_ID=MMETSP1347-20130617/20646_1 /ASSEMBLY_ACC=CAM_ASM_000690 /TAXON_ID=215587 /ORGANISM="Aplanochytrium stocchinoi, Strain GSBS06" /LENGTH=188 /DNA_ID=CAMNT_0052004771 /DNA_START=401 /DNA_END=967 /DNA_ORIENTATION=-
MSLYADRMEDIDLWKNEENSCASWLDVTLEHSNQPQLHTWEELENDSDSEAEMDVDNHDSLNNMKSNREQTYESIAAKMKKTTQLLSKSFEGPISMGSWCENKNYSYEVLSNKVKDSASMLSKSLPEGIGIWHTLTAAANNATEESNHLQKTSNESNRKDKRNSKKKYFQTTIENSFFRPVSKLSYVG